MRRQLLKALGQLFIALINATLILVVAAAISVWLALGALNSFVEDSASRLTEGALKAANVDPEALRSSLASIQESVAQLQAARSDPQNRERVVEALERIEGLVSRIEDQLAALSDVKITLEIDPAALSSLELALTRLLQSAVRAQAALNPAAPDEPDRASGVDPN